MPNKFIEMMKERRTIYNIDSSLPISQEKLITLVKEAVKEAPSSFNSQTSRVVILFGDEHKKLWHNITKETLKEIVAKEIFTTTEKKIDSFAAGAGTILFFEEQNVIKELQQKFPLYADNFPVWSEQSSGMAQYAVWASLAQEKVGASLQHYNPLIDEKVHASWKIPSSWKLRAQLVFGAIKQQANEKTYINDDIRFKVFGEN
ncbi:nitroreductase family protein [Arsenophonus nasoniae]|uniref:Nitroreductase family protein n=1 Tax=Arsenophonus nasoniae TaxID=638 RepID=A0AA95GE90_9GAMM|nr:nitroreductase family protein [Arsenophonus nasoniae]WGL94615.1 nitroreductase family protein [Arsenophonus nasoniae]WGM01073.1 nitroreductase family protein [Arsenophonus nasoniae]